MNALILINPKAAGGRAQKLFPLIQDHLNAHLGPVKHIQIEMPESIDAGLHLLAQTKPNTRVVIVGGDGTLNQVLPGLMYSAFEIGLVPYGSGNDCARAWGLHGMMWQEALQFALSGKAQAIDLGQVELAAGQTHFFHSSLAVGFDASVGNRALAGPKFLRGLPRYLLATFRELAHLRNWDMRISVDGVTAHQGTTLLGSTLNTPSYGGGMPAVPHALIDDGKLNLLMAGQFNRFQTLLMLPRLLMGLHLSHSRIKIEAFLRAEINSSQALPIAADGESLGFSNQISIEVLPSALNVIRR
jgi:YegS/Rv2252/BmrU family lipid kinase